MFEYFIQELLKGKDSRHFRGRMLLLLKKTDKLASLSNLRPITISSVFTKILETIILMKCKDRMIESINRNQIGFIPNLGCEIHLQNIMAQLLKRR